MKYKLSSVVNRNIIRASLITAALVLWAGQTEAATHFVRSGASGDGSSWASAWGDLSSIQWSSLSAGDTVCIAGGTYSGSITTGANGASGTPIVLRRAAASDGTCGSSTSGWNSVYDGQVVMRGTINIQNSYITIDGMKPNGISVIMQNPSDSYAGVSTGAPSSNVTLRYIEIAGPCANGQGCAQNGDQRGIQMESWNGSNWAALSDWLIQYANVHGACNNMVIYGAQNLVVEHSRFADSNTTGSTSYCHPNVVNTGSSNNVTWRYNEVTNWQVEGIMLLGGSGTWNVYGNVWHDPMSGSYPRVVETQDGSEGPVYLYNNTFSNLYFVCANIAGGTWASGTRGRNNIYWKSGGACGLPDEDNDYSDQSLSGEVHGQGSAPNPFVDLSGQDYQLASHTQSGLALPSPFNIDPDGKTRGLDGIWDRGAYQYGSSSAPAAPANLTTSVH
ncbi:MAG: hypothetical protein JOY54_08100 [Acidobacteriaceae bacterium]|nr:hypothetical protein [Acidobacteriaceae bacterium]